MIGHRLMLFLALAALTTPGLAYVCPVDMESTALIEDRGFDLSGQTHVITGGDSGIGKGIALALAKANARIIFLGHNMESTADVMKWITESTGNDKLSAIPIDLFSLASTQKAVEKVLEQTDRIDAVIGDAGSDATADGQVHDFITKDGFESTVQLEYVSHYYLVEKLLPELRKTKGRVVYTTTTGIDPYDTSTQGLCFMSHEDQGCQDIGVLSKSVHTLVDRSKVPTAANIMKGLYLRTLHARYLSQTEPDVTAYSFHPGMVATEGFAPFLEGKLMVIIGAVMGMIGGCALGALVGIVGGCAKGTCCRSACCGLFLGLVVGCLVGAHFLGSFGLSEVCGAQPWFACMCRGADGVQKTCPLNSLQGAVTGTYLAAAPTKELKPINGEMLVACGFHPTGAENHFDPYDTMVAAVGKEATEKYLRQLMDLSKTWAFSGGEEELISEPAPAMTATGMSIPGALPWLLVLGVVALFASKKKEASDQQDGNYLRLETETES